MAAPASDAGFPTTGRRTPLQQARLAGLRAIGTRYGRSRAGRSPEQVLLIRPDHLGDVLLLTPALHSLRAALPAAHLTLLMGPWGAQAVQGNPDLDAVEICVFPGFERQAKTSTSGPYQLLFETAAGLRGRFDAAVVLRFDHWWGAWLAAAAGIPRRVGYDWPETRPFLTEAVPYEPGRHEALQNARLLEALAPGIETGLGPSRYTVLDEDARWAVERLGRTPGRRVAIHPGAGAAVKQWPVDHWASVAAALHQARHVEIVLTGGPTESALGAAIAARLPFHVLDLAGQTSFGQLAAVYAACDVVLGSDSGPLHLAVAAGAKTVHLYGPVPAAKFGPWGDPARNVVLTSPFACVPCDRLDWPAHALSLHGCVAAIRPEAVIDAALSLIPL
jgi:heptosyltransferase-2/heptosyltransferase-3